ncbi:efflux RND transporter periplasmic adaptor subunit [Endozoicomonadaceae bacterium StTr2]
MNINSLFQRLARLPVKSLSVKSLLVVSQLVVASMYVQAENELESLLPVEAESFTGEGIRGQLRPTHYTTLAAAMTGILLEVSGRPGNEIKKGELLARFDCRENFAERDVATARRDGTKAKFDVNSRLAKLGNISELELEISRTEYAMATSEIKLLNARLSHCELRAPFSGQLTSRQVQPYQFVSMGDPMFELIDTSSLEVEMLIPSRELHRYQAGTRIQLTLDETGERVAARVDRVIGSIDPVSQTVRAIGRLEQHRGRLLPGMSGTIDLLHSGSLKPDQQSKAAAE